VDTRETKLGAQVAIRLPEDIAAFFTMIASHNGRTLAEEGRLAIQRHVERELDAVKDEGPRAMRADVENRARQEEPGREPAYP
jgi:hypothetical protein